MNTEICAPPGVTEPIVEFDNMKCSVTGGYVNHGTAAPGLANTYLFGDVCSGGIFAAVLQATTGV